MFASRFCSLSVSPSKVIHRAYGLERLTCDARNDFDRGDAARAIGRLPRFDRGEVAVEFISRLPGVGTTVFLNDGVAVAARMIG